MAGKGTTGCSSRTSQMESPDYFRKGIGLKMIPSLPACSIERRGCRASRGMTPKEIRWTLMETAEGDRVVWWRKTGWV